MQYLVRFLFSTGLNRRSLNTGRNGNEDGCGWRRIRNRREIDERIGDSEDEKVWITWWNFDYKIFKK